MNDYKIDGWYQSVDHEPNLWIFYRKEKPIIYFGVHGKNHNVDLPIGAELDKIIQSKEKFRPFELIEGGNFYAPEFCTHWHEKHTYVLKKPEKVESVFVGSDTYLEFL